MIGIRNVFKTLADVVFTSNTTLATIGLTSPIAKNEEQVFSAWVAFTLGATGGAKCEVVVPAGGSKYAVSITYFDSLTPAVDVAVQTSAAAFGKALANAGNYYAKIEGYVKNGSTAGNIDIQFAQNSSDANSLTILQGSWMEVIKLN